MTPSDPEIIDLHSAWRSLDKRVSRLEASGRNGCDPSSMHNRRTALDRLARKYSRFSILSLLCGIFVVPLIAAHVCLPRWKIPTLISMVCYFAIASAMDYWLKSKVQEIDVNTMPVAEVVRRAMALRKRHHQFMMILIPLCIAILTVLILGCGGDRYIVAGMATGAIIGLVIGIRQYLDFMRQYRLLSD